MRHIVVELFNDQYRIHFKENGTLKHIVYSEKIDEKLLADWLRLGVKP